LRWLIYGSQIATANSIIEAAQNQVNLDSILGAPIDDHSQGSRASQTRDLPDDEEDGVAEGVTTPILN
jgi:hypothetical protein